MRVQIQGSKNRLTATEIQQFEDELGVRLPIDYRDFLLEHNGGRPQPDSFPILGDPFDEHGICQTFHCLSSGDYYDLRRPVGIKFDISRARRGLAGIRSRQSGRSNVKPCFCQSPKGDSSI